MSAEQEDYLTRGWLPEQLAKGLIVKAGPYEKCPIVTALLLVPRPSAGQDFRVVQNLVPLNKRTKILRLPCRDVKSCRRQLGRARYLSQIDLKAGYFNVPLDDPSQRLTAFSTPQGTFFWTRMTQGLQNAPCWF